MLIQKNFLWFAFCLLVLNSCTSKKDLIYFSDLDVNKTDKIVFSESKIQINDILSVIISSSSPELAVNYNTNQNSSEAQLGYLVTLDGSITLPILGKIRVKDLTFEELEMMLIKELVNEDHLTNPIVYVRLLNAKFTILGEVNRPGTYNFTEQNISLLQALGYAGDLSIYGKRQNVLLIREENNQKNYVTLDLTSKQWFNSPYYYLKPNDVIYVNPNGTKIKSAGYIGNFATFISLVSVAFSTFLTILILSK
jgi:polysaccharide export outer membrane protein